jgi:DNA-binding response OmpR family regulator
LVVIKDEAENESKIIRVLLVDDNEDQTELTKLSLEMADPQFRVQIIEKPEEALELLHVSHFDCILSDYKMPSMDGIKFCLTVRNFSKVPFIIYTGQSCEEIASDAFEAGADDYMRKGNEPSHFNVLAHRIRHVVEKSQALKELEESRRDLNRAQALSQTGSWRLDIRHNVLTWSDETHRMFGIPERQLMSYDSFLSFVHPMDRAYVDAKWAEL